MVCHGLIKSLEERTSTIRIIETGKNFFKAKSGLNWKTIYIRLNPAVNPYDQLARELSRPFDNVLLGPYEKVSPLFEGQVKNLLRAPDNMGLVKIYERHPYIQRFNFLLIIDQFENLLFTTQINQEEKRNFVQLLLNATFFNQLLYGILAVRPPRNELWKQEFGDLKDAIETTDFPLYALDQKNLELAIDKYFQEESIRYKQRKTPHWQKIRPEKLKIEEHQKLTEEVYISDNPLKAMAEKLNAAPLKAVAETQTVNIKIKRIGGVNMDQKPREEVYSNPEEVLDFTPEIAELPETASLAEKAEFTYALMMLPEKRITRKVFLHLAEEAGVDPTGFVSIGDIVAAFGRFEQSVIAVTDKFAFRGVLMKQDGGGNPLAAKVRLTEVELSSDWRRFGEWIHESGKRIRLAEGGSGGTAMSKNFQPRAIAVDIPKESSALVDRAESTYQNFPLVLKRVCRKLFEALSRVPDLADGNPGKIRLGQITEEAGNFKRQFLEVADTLVQQGVLRGPDDGVIHFDAEIGVPKIELFMHWSRLREWAEQFREIPDKAPTPSVETSQKSEPEPQLESVQAWDTSIYQTPAPEADNIIRVEEPTEYTAQSYVSPTTTEPDLIPVYEPDLIPVYEPGYDQAPQIQNQGNSGWQGAEIVYYSLALPHKRVAQKLLVALAKSGGKAKMEDIWRKVGRFERQLTTVAETFVAGGILSATPHGHLDAMSEISYTNPELPQQWTALKKWMNENV